MNLIHLNQAGPKNMFYNYKFNWDCGLCEGSPGFWQHLFVYQVLKNT